MEKCVFCSRSIYLIERGEPCLFFKDRTICTDCALDLIEPIYKLSGTGNIQHFLFQECLQSRYNRKCKKRISNYRKIFKKLLKKYNFKCAFCGITENLTIDHKIPVSKGGTDNFSNLQILCKSCNSKKGIKILNVQK